MDNCIAWLFDNNSIMARRKCFAYGSEIVFFKLWKKKNLRIFLAK